MLGRPPEREEISEYLSKSLHKIDKVLQYGVHETSIDINVGEDQDTPLSDVLADPRIASPEDRILDEETQNGLDEAYADLTDQQRTVIAYRFGVSGGTPLTLQETGKMIGVSRERVRQIENQAKERMRRAFRRRHRKQPRAMAGRSAQPVGSRGAASAGRTSEANLL